MKRAEFLECVLHPDELPAGAGKELEEVIHLYPYFQGAYILHALALSQTKEIRFPESLKDAALHAGDRKHLYQLIHSPHKHTVVLDTIQEKTTELTSELIDKNDFQDGAEEALQPKIDAELPLPVEADILSQILTYPEIQREQEEEAQSQMEVVPLAEEVVENEQQVEIPAASISHAEPEGRHSFSFWLKKLTQETPVVGSLEHEESESGIEPAAELAPAEQLIERFIQTEPRISKPVKTEFFSPVSMAKKSVEDNEEIVSETLARIYAEQGSTDRAIRIYQKLSLLYPDKFDYFAALIQKLENPEFL